MEGPGIGQGSHHRGPLRGALGHQKLPFQCRAFHLRASCPWDLTKAIASVRASPTSPKKKLMGYKELREFSQKLGGGTC